MSLGSKGHQSGQELSIPQGQIPLAMQSQRRQTDEGKLRCLECGSWVPWWARQFRHRVQMSAELVCKGQVPEVSLDGARKSEGIREREVGEEGLLQAADEQKEGRPQQHQVRRLGAPAGLTRGYGGYQGW